MEKFHRDPSLAPNSNVAERVFSLKEQTSIRVTCHLESDRVTASHRLFLTPLHCQEQGYNLTFDPQAISDYQVVTIHPLYRHPPHKFSHFFHLSFSLCAGGSTSSKANISGTVSTVGVSDDSSGGDYISGLLHPTPPLISLLLSLSLSLCSHPLMRAALPPVPTGVHETPGARCAMVTRYLLMLEDISGMS